MCSCAHVRSRIRDVQSKVEILHWLERKQEEECVCVLFWGSGQNAKMREMNAKRQMDAVLICDILCTALYTSACVCVCTYAAGLFSYSRFTAK